MLRFLPAPDAFSRPLDDGLVVARSGGDQMFVLNPTARVVWDGLGEAKGPATLAARLAARHGVPIKRTRADVDLLLRQWGQIGLLDNGVAPEEGDTGQINGTKVPPASKPRVRHWINRDYAFAGVTLRVRCSNRDTSRCIDRVIAHLTVDGGANPATVLSVYSQDPGYRLFIDGEHLADCATIDEVLAQVTGALYDIGYESTDWRWVLRASAVGDSTGCVVMPTAAGNGKSTLAAALSARGLELYSDEVAPLIDDDLLVTPVPVSFSIKEGSWAALADWLPALRTAPVYARSGDMVRYVAPHRFARAPAPAKCIVFPRYEPEAALQIEEITPLEVMERINTATACLRAPLDARRVGAAVDWVSRTPAYGMTYGRLEDAVPAVVDLLRR